MHLGLGQNALLQQPLEGSGARGTKLDTLVIGILPTDGLKLVGMQWSLWLAMVWE